MNDVQYHALWDVLKTEGDRTKEFVEKYKEVRVQTSREKMANAHCSMAEKGGNPFNAMFMGSESLPRGKKYKRI